MKPLDSHSGQVSPSPLTLLLGGPRLHTQTTFVSCATSVVLLYMIYLIFFFTSTHYLLSFRAMTMKSWLGVLCHIFSNTRFSS